MSHHSEFAPFHSYFALETNSGILVDLIDRMLMVEPEKRFTIDQCLTHPWITEKTLGVNDSTDGLVAGIGGLEVQRRGAVRERTLLSSINSVQVANKIPVPNTKKSPVKVFNKNPTADKTKTPAAEPRPADQRGTKEFMELGGKGDQELFANDEASFYSKPEAAAAKGAKAKGKGKGKANGR